jgi:hypothetical protein
MRHRFLIAAAAIAVVGISAAQQPGGNPMTFFITSANPGKGGDLGGLAGADAWCQKLATDAGAGNKTWRAYLSTTASGGQPAVDARDRIGKGPWVNAKGVQIAANLDELHGQNKLTKETNINEKGGLVNGFGDTPNTHDMMTGSTPDGRVADNATCNNWTSSSTGTTMVGHHDRKGTNPDPVANASWNSSHRSAGCSTEALAKTGSGGLFYCFAAN